MFHNPTPTGTLVMILYVADGGTAKNFPDMTKETALEKFKDEIVEGGVAVISVEDGYAERLVENLDEEDEPVVEWEEIGRDFATE